MTHEQTKDTNRPANEAESMIGSVAADIRTAARHKYDEVVTDVRGKADDAKSEVAGEVNDVASALRHASEELRTGSAQERTLSQIANTIADASNTIRDKDLGEILAMLSRTGREHPALFLGGAALLGFAATRYAKASGGHSGGHSGSQDTRDHTKNKARVNDFVSEGNPNAHPVGTMP